MEPEPTHPFAVVADTPATWTSYGSSGTARDPGLILRAAGPTDDGYRTIEVWESEAAFREAGRPPGVSTGFAPVVRELRVHHLVTATTERPKEEAR
ncbi:MAG: hypothetical protein U0R50_14480 [Gaiellales bacterium]